MKHRTNIRNSRWGVVSMAGLGIWAVLCVGVVLGGVEVVEILPTEWEGFLRVQLAFLLPACPFVGMTLGIIGLVYDDRKVMATVGVMLNAASLIPGGMTALIFVVW